jgi:hypothetical protein
VKEMVLSRFKPSGVQVKLLQKPSANELDLGLPMACQIRSAVVLPKKTEKKKKEKKHWVQEISA